MMYAGRIVVTYLMETADELPAGRARGGCNQLGITAGASTPASIIKEVLVTMTEIMENKDPVDGEWRRYQLCRDA